MTDSLRNYGLPDSNVLDTPVAKPLPQGTAFVQCPNCGCEQMMEITVKVEQAMLSTPTGTGTYIGCPACPFATPMMVIANKETPNG